MTHWTFACVSDIHVGTPRSFRYQPAWRDNWLTARAQIVAMAPELLLVAGDLTRDGCSHRFELEQIRADLDALPLPWHAIPGNHDVGDKIPRHSTPQTNPLWATRVQPGFLDLYRSVFGPSEWSFEHRGVRFSAFNALLAGSGLPEEAVMWDWLDAQVTRPRARRQIWMMHPALFVHDLDEPNAPATDPMSYLSVDSPHRQRMMQVFRDTGAELVISGHLHARHQTTVEGITFQHAPSTAFRGREIWPQGDPSLGFFRCDVHAQHIAIEFIPLERESSAAGYGPGGNPPLEGRDYSLATELPPLKLEEQRRPRA